MSENLDDLIARYLEGLAGDDEIRELDARLRRDPEAQKAFFLAADQDVEMRRLLADERDARTMASAEPAPASRLRWAAGLAAAALAAAALAAVALWQRKPALESAPVVTYRDPSVPVPQAQPTPPAPVREAPATAQEPAPEARRAPDADPMEPPAAPEAAPFPATPPRPESPRPLIEIPPLPPAPRGGATAVTVAALSRAEGNVLVLGPGGPRAARAGQEILLDTGLETEEGGIAAVRYPDGTEIRLDGGTLVEKLSRGGKDIRLARGSLSARVTPQPPGHPFVVVTPQARAEVLGTWFTVSAGADATRLDVDEGRVHLTRTSDGASVEVGAGFTAMVAPNWTLRAVPQEGVDAVKVEDAIRKGIEHLRGKKIGSRNGNVLIFLTFVHGGVPASDPDLQELLKDALETELEHTYQVALTAMAFEEFDRVKYQGRIYQCAQFLADNIGPKGQTRYGVPTTFTEGTPSVSTAPPVKSPKGPKMYDPPPGSAGRERPPVTRILQAKQKRPGPGDHDHSNMQYAALGLRACHDAGIRFEPALLKLVEEWWREAQESDSGAKEETLYLDPPAAAGKGPGSTKSLTTASVAPQGWGYTKGGEPRGSMTAGAVGALCIMDYLLGKDWRQDKDVLEGMQWVSKNFSVTENPKVGDKNYYYYMYGLERAGVLYGTETIGSHKWYREGAKVLLQNQGADGKWVNTVDTCFAILFLKRATRPLVASQDSLRKK